MCYTWVMQKLHVITCRQQHWYKEKNTTATHMTDWRLLKSVTEWTKLLARNSVCPIPQQCVFKYQMALHCLLLLIFNTKFTPFIDIYIQKLKLKLLSTSRLRAALLVRPNWVDLFILAWRQGLIMSPWMWCFIHYLLYFIILEHETRDKVQEANNLQCSWMLWLIF